MRLSFQEPGTDGIFHLRGHDHSFRGNGIKEGSADHDSEVGCVGFLFHGPTGVKFPYTSCLSILCQGTQGLIGKFMQQLGNIGH